MRDENAVPEQRMAAVATGQHGNVTTRQLIAVGFSRSAIGRRVAKGLLIRQHPGVYRVGDQRRSALHGGGARRRPRRPPRRPSRRVFDEAGARASPDPAVLARRKKRIQGVTVRTEAAIDPRDTTVWYGIPATTIARTLVDLASVLDDYQLGQAWHQARVLYRTQPEDVEAV